MMVLSCAAWGQGLPSRDAQEWTDLQVTKHLRHHWTVGAVTSMRFESNFSHFAEQHFGAGASYSPRKFLVLSPSYKYQRATYGRGTHHENRLTADATARLPLPFGFALFDRNRAELRYLETGRSERYRNRALLEHKLKIHEHTMTPYFGEEVFYDSRYRQWNRLRVEGGLKIPLAPHLGLDACFLHQDDERARPRGANIIWTTFRVQY